MMQFHQSLKESIHPQNRLLIMHLLALMISLTQLIKEGLFSKPILLINKIGKIKMIPHHHSAMIEILQLWKKVVLAWGKKFKLLIKVGKVLVLAHIKSEKIWKTKWEDIWAERLRKKRKLRILKIISTNTLQKVILFHTDLLNTVSVLSKPLPQMPIWLLVLAVITSKRSMKENHTQ